MLNIAILGLCIGVAGVFLAPAALKPTQLGTKIANTYARFVVMALKRPAITVGKNSDLTLRQLETDDVFNRETAETGGVKRMVSRAGDVHRLGSSPLAFVDEEYGVTFDLRDLLVTAREHRIREDGQIVQTLEQYTQGELTRLQHYFRAFFEFDERQGLSMDLDKSIRPVVDGSEKAHWHERMDEAVRRMFIDRQDGIPFMKMLLPGLGLALGLVAGYYLLGPGQMPGSSGSSGVTVGLLGGALSTESIRDWVARVRGDGDDGPDRDIPWRAIAAVVGAGAAIGAVAMLALTLGVVLTVVALGGMVAGAAILPLLTLVFGAIGKGAALGELLLAAGFMGLQQPTMDQREDGRYEIVEADEVDVEAAPTWKFAKTLVRFTCEVSPRAFGPAGYDAADVEEVRDSAIADGGQPARKALPSGYEPSGKIERATHQAFVPSDADASTTYVRSDQWLSRFKDAATGSTLDVAEKEARKKYAAGDPDVSDQRLMGYSLALAALGFGFWVVIAFAF